jgi:hypothetical protein
MDRLELADTALAGGGGAAVEERPGVDEGKVPEREKDIVVGAEDGVEVESGVGTVTEGVVVMFMLASVHCILGGASALIRILGEILAKPYPALT